MKQKIAISSRKSNHIDEVLTIEEFLLGKDQKYTEVPILSVSTMSSDTSEVSTSFTVCSGMPFSLVAAFSRSFSRNGSC